MNNLNAHLNSTKQSDARLLVGNVKCPHMIELRFRFKLIPYENVRLRGMEEVYALCHSVLMAAAMMLRPISSQKQRLHIHLYPLHFGGFDGTLSLLVKQICAFCSTKDGSMSVESLELLSAIIRVVCHHVPLVRRLVAFSIASPIKCFLNTLFTGVCADVKCTPSSSSSFKLAAVTLISWALARSLESKAFKWRAVRDSGRVACWWLRCSYGNSDIHWCKPRR